MVVEVGSEEILLRVEAMVHSWLDTRELDYLLWHASDLAYFAFSGGPSLGDYIALF